MSTQTNQSSPFQSNTNQNPTSTEEFSIRTMKDDLVELQKNGVIETQKNTSAAIEEQPKRQEPVSTLVATPISIQKEEPQKEASFSKNPNPFLEQIPAPIPEKKEEPKKPLPAQTNIEITNTKTIEKQPSSRQATQAKTPSGSAIYKALLGFVLVLVLAIIGLGGYYFWVTRTPKQEIPAVAETPTAEETPTAIEETVVIAPPTEKYSDSKANYLILDISTASADSIHSSIETLLTDLKEKSSSSLYEFIPVDANNNPIAFPIFATAAKFNLSPTLLSTLGGTFSLFIYNDNGIQHLGLSANIKKQDLFAKEIVKQEKTFIADASFLFFNATPEVKTGQFGNGKYKDFSTKYLNLNKQETLSIDYTSNNSQFFIGTSKNTLRAIIDRAPNKQQEIADSKQSDTSCTNLPAKLLACSQYSCLDTVSVKGFSVKKEVRGIINGKCQYTEQLPNNGNIECNFSEDMRKKVSELFKAFAPGKSFSVEVDNSTNNVNGESNPLQEAFDTKQCVLSGY